MTVAFILMVSLIAFIPALMMVDGILATGVVAAIASIAMMTVALAPQTNELNRFSRLLGPTALVLSIPCLWMLLQVLPIPSQTLANPVWVSASLALGKPFLGAISLDISATLLSLARYCAILGAAVVIAAVSLKSDRAERAHFLLTGIATVIAAEVIAYNLGLRLPGHEHLGDNPDAMNIAAIGLILSSAMAIGAYEQHSSRSSRAVVRAAALPSLTFFFICASALLIIADPVLLFAGLYGTGIMISALIVRKWDLRLFGQAGVAAIAAVALVAFVAVATERKDADPTLALSPQDHVSSIRRMLLDAKWAGSGAGSFKAMLPIYRATDEADSLEVPTAAATIAIEMGRPFFWTWVIVAIVGAVTLFRRALLRGRDYIYSSAAAGCIMALIISLFANDGFLGLGSSLILGAVGGLGLAQSKSPKHRGLESFERLYEVSNITNSTPRQRVRYDS